MFIQTEETPNPQTLKVIPGVPVLAEGTAEFLSAGDVAGQSPLADRLFHINGVQSVFFGYDFVAVTKQDNVQWADIRTYILGILFELFSLGQPVMAQNSAAVDTANLSDTERQIIELIDTRVRPAVARDGGDIVFQRFDKGVVWLKMQGACAGCPSSTMTLKMGIENMLRNYIPEVLEVRAVND